MLARGFARELGDRLRASSHARLNEPTMTGHEIESRASPSKSCRCDAGSPAARAADRSCGKAALSLAADQTVHLAGRRLTPGASHLGDRHLQI